MRRLAALARVARRLAAAAAVTLLCYLPLVAGSVLLAPWRRRRLAWATAVFRCWARLLGRAMGMRATVRGRPPVPPFLLVANHLSYMDILLLGGATGAIFVAKSEIAGWPVLGHLSRLVGTVFVARASRRDLVRASQAIGERLARGRGVVLFPEGGITAGGGLEPFRAALLHPAVEAGLPVHWAVVRYATGPGQPPAGEAVVWQGPLLPHVRRLLALPGFRGELVFGGAVREADRKALARRLHDATTAALGGAGSPGGIP